MGIAEDSFREGKLGESLAALQAEVRQRPADVKPRVFLAQLLMVQGQWERALTQLSVIAEMDSQALPMAQMYRSAIMCETLRTRVFTGERSPLLFGDPEPWTALMLQAAALDTQGQHAKAAEVRATALESAPATPGTFNGSEFEWIADGDSRLGPMFEMFINNAYYWVPIHRVSRIAIDPPEDVRDLVWLPAQCTWSNGGEALALMPVRYPGSEAVEDNAIRLSRKTDWQQKTDDSYFGLGQRLFNTDQAEFGLLELRELNLRGSSE